MKNASYWWWLVSFKPIVSIKNKNKWWGETAVSSKLQMKGEEKLILPMYCEVLAEMQKFFAKKQCHVFHFFFPFFSNGKNETKSNFHVKNIMFATWHKTNREKDSNKNKSYYVTFPVISIPYDFLQLRQCQIAGRILLHGDLFPKFLRILWNPLQVGKLRRHFPHIITSSYRPVFKRNNQVLFGTPIGPMFKNLYPISIFLYICTHFRCYNCRLYDIVCWGGLLFCYMNHWIYCWLEWIDFPRFLEAIVHWTLAVCH